MIEMEIDDGDILTDEEKGIFFSLEGKLKCEICHNVFSNPVNLPCGHVFCRNCIINWLQRQHYCFNCKTPVGSKELIRSTFMDHICQSYTNLFQILRQDANVASIESDHVVKELSPQERSQSHSEAVNTPSIDQDHSSYSKRETQSAASIFTPEIKSTEPNSVSETSYNNDQVSNTCRFWFEINDKKKEIENLLRLGIAETGSTLPSASLSPAPELSDDVTHSAQRSQKIRLNSEETTASLSQFVATTATSKPLRAIVSYQSLGLKKLAEECTSKGLLTCFGEEILFTDDPKLFIVETNITNPRLTKRSILYIKCLLLGYYIIDSEWMKEVLELGRITDISRYEVQGSLLDHNYGTPQKLRLTERDHEGRVSLLKNYSFLIIDGDSESMNQSYRRTVEWMIRMCSGAILLFPTTRENNGKLIRLKLKFPSKRAKAQQKEIQDTSNFILSMSWLIDAICNYEIPQDVSKYILSKK